MLINIDIKDIEQALIDDMPDMKVLADWFLDFCSDHPDGLELWDRLLTGMKEREIIDSFEYNKDI